MNKCIKPKSTDQENKNVKHKIFTNYYDVFNEKLQTKQKELISNNDEIYSKFLKKIDLNCGFLNISLKDKKDICKFESLNEKNNAKNEKAFEFAPIGYLESCFPEKFSVPRQGNLLKLTKAKIIFNSNIDIVNNRVN